MQQQQVCTYQQPSATLQLNKKIKYLSFLVLMSTGVLYILKIYFMSIGIICDIFIYNVLCVGRIRCSYENFTYQLAQSSRTMKCLFLFMSSVRESCLQPLLMFRWYHGYLILIVLCTFCSSLGDDVYLNITKCVETLQGNDRI